MAATSVLKIDILADVKKAAAGIDEIDGKLGNFMSGLGKVAAAVGTAFAVKQVFDFAAAAATAAAESEKVSKATGAIIAATGGAAGVTADEVSKLATSISTLTAVDDELVQSGANVLLTFKNVKQAGEGLDDVFGRATAAGVDLAAAGFGDVIGNAKMLGKALNDPIAGLSSLSRAGVTFTAQQRQQITELAKTGDLLGAQKIILAEVEAQVGGTAAASASSLDKMKVAFGNAQETIGAALLPIINELLPVLTTLLDELVPVVVPVAAELGKLAATLISAVMPAIKPLIPVVAMLAQTIGAQLGRIINAVAPILPPLAAAFGKILGAVAPLIPPVVDLVLAFTPLLPPLVRIIALAADVAAMLSSKLQPVISAVAKIVSGFASAVGWLIDKLASLFNWLVKVAQKLSNPVFDAIGSIIGGIGDLFSLPAVDPAPALARSGTTRSSSRATLGGGVTIVAGFGADPLTIGPQVVDVLARYERRNGSWNRLTPAVPSAGVDQSDAINSLDSRTTKLELAVANAGTGTGGRWDTPQQINHQPGTTYRLNATDAGKLVTLSSSSPVLVTVPAGLGLTVGQRIDLAQIGTGPVTVDAAGTVINATPGRALKAQYTTASLIVTGPDQYMLIGDLMQSAIDVLADAVFWIDAARSSVSNGALTNLGTGGSSLDAVFGNTTGVDSFDPALLTHTGTNYLYLSGGSTNNNRVESTAPSATVTGDIEVVCRLGATKWHQATGEQSFYQKWSTTGNQKGISFKSTPTGFIVYYSVDGIATLLLPLAALTTLRDGENGWLRFRFQPNNGGVSTFTVHQAQDSPTEPTTWVQVGSSNGTSVASTFASNATVTCFGGQQGGAGAIDPFTGRAYRVLVRNGFGGTAVFDADFTTGITSGAQTTFTESSANAARVTINRGTSGRKAVAVTRPILLFGTDDHLDVVDADLLDFGSGDSFTVIAVQRVWATPSTGRAIVAKKTDLTAASQGWALSSGSTTALPGQLQIADGTTAVASVSGDRAIGTLQVVTGVRNTTTGTLTTWINKTAGSPVTDATGATTANAEVMRIGRLSGASTQNVDMELVAALVFRRALTADEIALIVDHYS
jgi:hypothetical protein